MKKLILPIFALFLITACGQSDNSTPEMDDTPNGPSIPFEDTTEARYRVSFVSTWSSLTHPTQFPSNPHFSGLVGAVHNSDISLWSLNSFATPGIEAMAEFGGKSALLSEVQTFINQGDALSTLSGGGISLSPGSVSMEFTVSEDYSLVSLVSMLAPSPDWFVGVSGLNLLLSNGSWVEILAVNLQMYDAGTDDGSSFVSANSDSNQPITRLTSNPSDSDFISGQPFVGQFIFERIE